jgi:hypothetical protein
MVIVEPTQPQCSEYAQVILTGLARVVRLGQRLRTPIRRLSLGHNLGQPCANFVAQRLSDAKQNLRNPDGARGRRSSVIFAPPCIFH